MKNIISAILMAVSISAFANGRCMSPSPVSGSDCRPPTQFIPVLMYHRVTTEFPPSDTVIGPRLFTRHLNMLLENGYTTVTVSQVAEYMRGEITLPEKSVALTFDDGWADNFSVSENLRVRGMTGTFYIITNTFGDPQYLTSAQVGEISRTNEIGSHSESHFMQYVSNFSKIPSTQMIKEFATSKATLEFIVGKPIISLSWPFGYNRPELNTTLEEMGYKSAVLVNADSQNVPGNSAMQIHRIIVDGGCNDVHLLRMIKSGKEGPCNENNGLD